MNFALHTSLEIFFFVFSFVGYIFKFYANTFFFLRLWLSDSGGLFSLKLLYFFVF